MSRFISGEWGGHKYIIEPLGWRRVFRLGSFVPPYLVGSKIRWRIKLKTRKIDSNPLNGFDIFEIVNPHQPRKIPSHRNLPVDSKEFRFINERVIAQTGEAQYWLGEPGGENSFLLISADVISNDKIIIMVMGYALSAIIGGIVGAIVAS